MRECLRLLNIQEGVEIHHAGDLPARSGMGTSSSFTVALLHALHVLKGEYPLAIELADEAIHVEQDLAKESVGDQDQVTAAFGGLNRIDFHKGGGRTVTPMRINENRLMALQDSLMLFFTGFARTASQMAEIQIQETPNRERELTLMQRMVDQGVAILEGNSELSDFGKLLAESWALKRSLTNAISSPYIDYVYERGIQAGATGGKVLGAGGGGFILFFVPPGEKARVRANLSGLLEVPFQFESRGSYVISDKA